MTATPATPPTTTTHLDLQGPDGPIDAYLVRPEGDGPYPAVLFLMDAFGLRPQIEEMAARIAADGYVVLAPNLLYRGSRSPIMDHSMLGDPDRRHLALDQVRPMMAELTAERMVADAAVYLELLDQIAPGPVAILGYCMGGRHGWRVATAYGDKIAALAAFHTGGLATDAPDSPHLSADQIEAELYLAFADNDASATPEQIELLERSLDAIQARYASEIYVGAAHGYTMADTAAYNYEASERHYDEVSALLARTLLP